VAAFDEVFLVATGFATLAFALTYMRVVCVPGALSKNLGTHWARSQT
jgi:hypothetical protein